MRRRSVFVALSCLAWAVSPASPARADRPNSVVLFVADGLRGGIVNPQTAPNMAALRGRGVAFPNSHSLFPTFTTANASAMATGHYLGDTGDFSNTINVGFPVQAQLAASHHTWRTMPFWERLTDVSQATISGRRRF